MSIIVVDTETTGLPAPRLDYLDPRQPYLVEIGAVLAEDDGTERASLSLVLKPDGWEIPAEAAAVHGITTELATAIGVPALVALSALTHLWACADTLVCFNLPFDLRIINIAIARTGRPSLLPRPAQALCAMEMATPILNLPPTERMLAVGFNKPKRPSLQEAHIGLLGEPFTGAHGALADARAALRVFIEIQRRKQDEKLARESTLA